MTDFVYGVCCREAVEHLMTQNGKGENAWLVPPHVAIRAPCGYQTLGQGLQHKAWNLGVGILEWDTEVGVHRSPHHGDNSGSMCSS